MMCGAAYVFNVECKTNAELDPVEEELKLSDEEFEKKHGMTKEEYMAEGEEMFREKVSIIKEDFSQAGRDAKDCIRDIAGNAKEKWNKQENKEARQEMRADLKAGTKSFFSWLKKTFEDFENKNDAKRVKRK